MYIVRDFRDEYNFREIMSQERPKKEKGELIKVPEYVIRFREEYNIKIIKGERPPKKEEKEQSELPDYIKRFREEYGFIRRR
jgi:hypothetical protein